LFFLKLVGASATLIEENHDGWQAQTARSV